ncbi:MAG TPA: hypothetical protein VHE61_04985, partial [Opitutaceae bacterium]|nr:hypothetical protein [Opitutaceae bacterium]
NRIDYLGFFNAEGTEYLSRQASVHHESEAYAGLEWRYLWPDVLNLNLDAQGYYLDQVFDVSDTDVTRLVAELQLTGIKVGPTLRVSLRPWLWLEGSVKGDRQKFRDGANDARVVESYVRLGWQPSDRFELSLAGWQRRRGYDRHPRYKSNGAVDIGVLVVHERELEGRVVATWGHSGHWKTRTRAGGLEYIDNGAGFLNYRQHHAGQEFDWSAGDWLVHAEATAARKVYQLQTVGRGIAVTPEVKEEFDAQLRIERKVAHRWTIYAEYDWERSRSNDEIASYRMNEGLLGARWSWEK